MTYIRNFNASQSHFFWSNPPQKVRDDRELRINIGDLKKIVLELSKNGQISQDSKHKSQLDLCFTLCLLMNKPNKNEVGMT